jgi:DNA-binding CsgD family transcriptional regulator
VLQDAGARGEHDRLRLCGQQRQQVIAARSRIPTPRDYTATIDAIIRLVARLESETGKQGTVGIGIPGVVTRATGLVKNANSTWLNGRPFDRDRNGIVVSEGGCVYTLERLEEAAEEGGRNGSLIEILILQALSHEVQSDIFAALIPLERALSLAAPEGYARIFLDEGAPMATLLSEAAARGIMPDYTGRLLAAFEAEGLTTRNKPRLVPARPGQPLIEPLSQRELEVLQLVAHGLSNREISERLFVALSTVKGHNRIIFDKLGVRRRTEAVARARELGIL